MFWSYNISTRLIFSEIVQTCRLNKNKKFNNFFHSKKTANPHDIAADFNMTYVIYKSIHATVIELHRLSKSVDEIIKNFFEETLLFEVPKSRKLSNLDG